MQAASSLEKRPRLFGFVAAGGNEGHQTEGRWNLITSSAMHVFTRCALPDNSLGPRILEVSGNIEAQVSS